MNKILFGMGVYALAYIICFKPGPFGIFTQYRTFLAEKSVENDWLLSLAACPLCVALVLNIIMSLFLKPQSLGEYIVNFFSMIGIAMIMTFVSNKCEV